MSDLNSNVLLELHVPDFGVVKDFYGDIGYEVVWEKPSEADSLDYLVMRNGDSILNFYGNSDTVSNHSYFKKFNPETPRGYGVEIIIQVEDIESFYIKFKSIHKESMATNLQHKHSRKDFRAVDPFGFYLRFVEKYNWVEGRDKLGKPVN